MTTVWQVQIEFRKDDDGLTAKVTSRHGSTGECPPTEIHHDSHFLDDAIRCLNRMAKESKRAAQK